MIRNKHLLLLPNSNILQWALEIEMILAKLNNGKFMDLLIIIS